MNHNGNANKMVDTPRTDKVNQYLRTRRDYKKTDNEVWIRHSIKIERELNAANERIKRLKEARDDIFLLAQKHAPEYWLDAQTAFDKWLKAKEAKP